MMPYFLRYNLYKNKFSFIKGQNFISRYMISLSILTATELWFNRIILHKKLILNNQMPNYQRLQTADKLKNKHVFDIQVSQMTEKHLYFGIENYP